MRQLLIVYLPSETEREAYEARGIANLQYFETMSIVSIKKSVLFIASFL